jgi:uncharacterized caspase-like protein/lipoprotein NlpI
VLTRTNVTAGMCRFLMVTSIILQVARLSLMPAIANDQSTCLDENFSTPEAKIAACTSAMVSRKTMEAHILSRALNNRGWAYRLKEDYENALADFNEAIRIDSKFAVALNNRGVIFNIRGEYDRGIADLNRAARLDPKLAFAFSNRGFANWRKGNRDLAIKDLDRAIRLSPDLAVAYSIRGNVVFEKDSKNSERAIADFNNALRLDPKLAYAYDDRGIVLLSKGEFDAAIDDHTKAIALDPSLTAAFTHRGLAYEKKNDFRPARSDYVTSLGMPQKYVNGKWAHDTARARLAALPASSPAPATTSASTSSASLSAAERLAASMSSSSKPKLILTVEASPTTALPDTPLVPPVASGSSPTGRRIALVVGVSNYEHAGYLPNTINDAKDMSEALKRMGFDVDTLLDPSRTILEAALRRYGDRSTGADVSVFHYSGHALEAGGHNWILPATANINSERDLRFEAIDLDTILAQTDGAARVSIVFLDACRDNHLARRISSVGRALTRGLARIDMTAGGVLVAFSTAPGQIALDGEGASKNSPFTAALLSHIETPGLEIKSLLARVTKDVVEETKGKQRPWQNSSLEGEFYFQPAQGGAAAPVAPSAVNLDVIFWESIKSSHDPKDFEAYLAQFQNGVFVELARNRLTMLRKQAAAIPAQRQVSPPVAQDPPLPTPQKLTGAPQINDALRAQLVAAFVATNEAEKRARDYAAEPDHKAIAIAPKAHLTWRQGGSPNAAAATTATLEKCQVYYQEPCTLIAADNSLEPSATGAPPPRDMPRTRYAGRFEPERIPGAAAKLLERADVISYHSAAGPKAAAYHPWGRLFVSTGLSTQFEAEAKALFQCNNDPDRKGRDGECFLYAVGDRVVLPQRLTKARPRPQTISEAFAYFAVPRYSYRYGDDKGHKAIAIAPENGQTFRSGGGQASTAVAEANALEGCQLQYHTPCVTLASDETLQATDLWSAERHDMSRLHYVGAYKPQNVPLFSGTENELTSYVTLPQPKAMVVRPNGLRVRTATGATLEEAQLKALSACNDDLDIFPCLVYAVNDLVVLEQRRTEPLK